MLEMWLQANNCELLFSPEVIVIILIAVIIFTGVTVGASLLSPFPVLSPCVRGGRAHQSLNSGSVQPDIFMPSERKQK